VNGNLLSTTDTMAIVLIVNKRYAAYTYHISTTYHNDIMSVTLETPYTFHAHTHLVLSHLVIPTHLFLRVWEKYM